jgi:phosphatidylserine/phosphatidylglycerophosphate/cardiolipin synthase-like enzyme
MSELRPFFGGPDRTPRLLRDLLEEKTDAVPSGGEIGWVTYYFRDRALAAALVRARRRGVRVTVSLEASPRLRTANDGVRRQLEGNEGLGVHFRAVRHALPCNLHAKLYYFSHPTPTALVGSFNPSGDRPEDPDVIREIGDQDRGHNVLVEIAHPGLADGLARHADWVHRGGHGVFERFGAAANRCLEADGHRVFFFPRRRSDVVRRLLSRLSAGSRARIAASHIRDMSVVRALGGLARRGVRVEIVAHDSERRVPRRIEAACVRSGIAFRRYVHPDRLPMHNKFMLLEGGNLRQVLFGSMNLTRSSRWLNHELVVVSEEPRLFGAFAERWEAIAAEPWTKATDGSGGPAVADPNRHGSSEAACRG